MTDRVVYFVTLAITLDPGQMSAGLLTTPDRWDWKTLLHEEVKVIALSGPITNS